MIVRSLTACLTPEFERRFHEFCGCWKAEPLLILNNPVQSRKQLYALEPALWDAMSAFRPFPRL